MKKRSWWCYHGKSKKTKATQKFRKRVHWASSEFKKEKVKWCILNFLTLHCLFSVQTSINFLKFDWNCQTYINPFKGAQYYKHLYLQVFGDSWTIQSFNVVHLESNTTWYLYFLLKNTDSWLNPNHNSFRFWKCPLVCVHLVGNNYWSLYRL